MDDSFSGQSIRDSYWKSGSQFLYGGQIQGMEGLLRLAEPISLDMAGLVSLQIRREKSGSPEFSTVF